jgi:isocitrate dehydrogenase (NAD+)
MQGDQTGQELLDEALRVLSPFTPKNIHFKTFDLSLENRRATKNQVVYDAAEAVKTFGLGLKAATITPGDPDDVGSPNAILREAIGAQVILRIGRRMPPVRPIAGVHAPIAVVRMAVDDAYGAKEWREGEGLDEIAYRTEHISRRTCRAVAEFAFHHAAQVGAKVCSKKNWTLPLSAIQRCVTTRS